MLVSVCVRCGNCDKCAHVLVWVCVCFLPLLDPFFLVLGARVLAVFSLCFYVPLVGSRVFMYVGGCLERPIPIVCVCCCVRKIVRTCIVGVHFFT